MFEGRRAFRSVRAAGPGDVPSVGGLALCAAIEASQPAAPAVVPVS